eukprot:13665598-Ditylum_brightwellii.AAC.2
MDNIDVTCTLVQDLLRGDALTMFNNKQAMFKEQMTEILEHCLNAMTIQVFPNKFSMPAGVEAKKLEQEELLEVLENRIPILWKFQMNKEGFDASSSTLKYFTKTCVCYKECKPKVTEKTYHEWGQDSPWHHSDGRGHHHCK